jgi:hypothetical protein
MRKMMVVSRGVGGAAHQGDADFKETYDQMGCDDPVGEVHQPRAGGQKKSGGHIQPEVDTIRNDFGYAELVGGEEAVEEGASADDPSGVSSWLVVSESEQIRSEDKGCTDDVIDNAVGATVDVFHGGPWLEG